MENKKIEETKKYHEKQWMNMYEVAKNYYIIHNNLLVPQYYVTAEGKKLGKWISAQREKYKKGLLSKERIRLLEDIGMVWNYKKEIHEKQWINMYEVAKKYYEEYENLLVPQRYVTEDGVYLGTWIDWQRQLYKKGKLKKERILLLEAIGMVWKVTNKSDIYKKIHEGKWEYGYEVAKKYYEEHGNLFVPHEYVTEDGYRLGNWINWQRQEYKKGQLSEERILLLEAIGMVWDFWKQDEENRWIMMYEIAKRYFIENKNLLVPQKYVTKDGYNLGTWIGTQRVYYKKGKLSEDRILKLEAIGMVWVVSRYGHKKAICNIV